MRQFTVSKTLSEVNKNRRFCGQEPPVRAEAIVLDFWAVALRVRENQ